MDNAPHDVSSALEAAKIELSLARSDLARADNRLESLKRVPLAQNVDELRAELSQTESRIDQLEPLAIAFQQAVADRQHLRTKIAASLDCTANFDAAESTRIELSRRVVALESIIAVLAGISERQVHQ